MNEESKRITELLKFDSAMHKKLSPQLKNRLRLSESKMKNRYSKMAQNEELFQAYVPERDVDRLRKLNKSQNGVPEYTTIELPYSYATAMTAHTYYTSVFLSRSPVFQLAGRHGEAENKRLALESLLSYQIQVGMALLPMFVWLLDPAKYGFGVLGHYWDKETVRVRNQVMQPRSFLGLPIPGTDRLVDVVEDVIGYEGSRFYNIRAQDFFPDPRFAIVHFQKGEFCGRYCEISWQEIYEGSKSGRYFNYDALKRLRSAGDKDNQTGGAPARDEGGRDRELPTQGFMEDAYDVPVGIIKGHEIFVKLIPKDWKLADSDRHEVWVFNVASNGCIFGAMPLGEYHNKFPMDILVDEVDGYSLFPNAMLERVKPLNDVMTWLVNSHFYNVRQTLNNQFVVDPSMVVMKDVENPGPGMIIRLKPAAYGKDVRQAVTQLQSVDITRTHIGDVGFVQGFIERVTGANDSMMGMMEQGGRKTATEVRTSTNFGVTRLKTMCEWYSITGFSPMVQKVLQRTQQRYSGQKQFRMVGDQAAFAPNFAMVTPADIAGFYDYEGVDGTLPVDRFAQANLWKELMANVMINPRIAQKYDIARIFAWVAQLAGIKNMSQFRLMPDQAMMQQVQAGNAVPLAQAQAEMNPQEPGQIPGMGASG